jgi:butyryl-CoA:acetate CoA-transferase
MVEMTYQQLYNHKLISAEEAVQFINSGDWVDYGFASGTPDKLDRALAARAEELTDVKVRGGILMKRPAIFDVENVAQHFTWNSWHMSGIERKAAEEGFAFYTPIRFSEVPRYYRSHIIADDVAMFQVAPMDEHGYFNFGPNTAHMEAVCDTAKLVIVEVNQNMPRCLGGTGETVHISRVDYIVEGDNPPIAEMVSATPSELDHAVARTIVEKIPNGACLQLGIGGMPNAVGSLIANDSDLKDLGAHTEMMVDAFVDLAHSGKLTGAKKTVDRGRQVFTFGAGTRKLYDHLDNNPFTMAAPADYTNDTRVISSIDNFISINSAVDVDLYGQVNAESSGTRQISGAGGQLDFVMGSYLSRGGKSFICLSSTFKDHDGNIHSRIVPTLSPGSIVTSTRSLVDNIVTEYGMVCLKGLSTWQRAEKLISIAHPDFREDLIRQAEQMHIWRRTNTLPL